MDQATRNRLRNVVTQCRRLLEEAVAYELQGRYGIHATPKKDEVVVEDAARMGHLSDEERAFRRDLIDHYEHIRASGAKPRDALEQLKREIAFTHLNRLCAYKMMEAREVYVGGEKFREAVSRGVNSNGVKFYLAEHPEDERLFNTGHQDVAYRHFLDWLGGRLSDEIGILFSPDDPANRLYPPQRVLDEVLALINDEALAGIWSQDEAIGWVYQYFTPKELRDQARKESQAPRNSYELAFRNQFFTPRYVVEFLTDNTLGRIWYEMRKGDTAFRDRCRYMVRRPTEVFLDEGQTAPEDAEKDRADLSQEELLKLPVYIPHRPRKDPREIRLLDPAVGSAHFLLYAFDLLLTIYDEAYTDPDLGPALQQDYPTLDDLRRAVPGLILERNLHGIDIDLRATQIAALALWLRCQRAYQEMGLKKDRPKITRSNIVCAEPMPGEEALLDEFLRTMREDRLEVLIRRGMDVPEGGRVRATQAMAESLAGLIRTVWEKMRLAGEAGSLLKVEEELQEAIRRGQEEWEERLPLFRYTEYGLDDGPKERLVRFVPGDVEGDRVTFWDRAEGLVRTALDEFAEFASNGGRLQRRLFAGDARQGLGFVDVCRQRFDVVLMNPPFGGASKPSKAYVERAYPRTKNDVYAAFVERGLLRLHPGGRLGAITSRTGFFLTSFQKWREEILLGEARPAVLADLGYGILDTAMVETAAYCLARGQQNGSSSTDQDPQAMPTLFLRLLTSADKPAALANAVQRLRDGQACPDAYAVEPESFRQVPGAPFAYWVSERVRRVFVNHPMLGSDGRDAQFGASTKNDSRFLRGWWEVPMAFTARSRAETVRGKRWVALAKGGIFAAYYSNYELVIDWANDGQVLKDTISEYRGSRGWGYQWSAALNGYQLYFRSGLTWSRRTTSSISVRVLPEGCIFGDKGPTLFSEGDRPWSLAGLMNSRAFMALAELQLAAADAAARSYEVGLIQRMPVPEFSGEPGAKLGDLARAAVDLKRSLDTANETSHVFHLPAQVQVPGATLAERVAAWQTNEADAERQLAELQREIDDIAFRLYGIDGEDRRAMEAGAETRSTADGEDEFGEEDEEDDAETATDARSLVVALVSYAVGAVFGRWDLRYATGERTPTDLPDPFAPLLVCSPGMLQGPDGLPPTSPPEGYPLRIDADGLLVDDPSHADDIVRRVRDVLELVWKGRADAIEREACEILGVKELRDYVRKPGKGGFWDDHISRYSRSRRKAPIYWLLQSSKKNYALWLYYHRLDKDILFKALTNYVEPKVRLEDGRLDALRAQKQAAAEPGRGSKKLDKEIERQEEFVSELRDFADKLARAARLDFADPETLDSSVTYDPDLNDGVVLNIAPLHELVPWKEARTYWDALMKGEYEWSSIARRLRAKGLVP